jgi:hypothetical protein
VFLSPAMGVILAEDRMPTAAEFSAGA